MPDDPLTVLSDIQLMNLFSASATLALSARAKQIIAQLEKRGYIFDPRRGDFITCEQWNQRHADYAPMDCYRQSKNLERY